MHTIERDIERMVKRITYHNEDKVKGIGEAYKQLVEFQNFIHKQMVGLSKDLIILGPTEEELYQKVHKDVLDITEDLV